MHDGMQYDPIQGQGHEALKFGNSAISKGYRLGHFPKAIASPIYYGGWQMTTGQAHYAATSAFRFLIFALVCVT